MNFIAKADLQRTEERPFKNRLLRTLPEDELHIVQPLLEPVELRQGDYLTRCNRRIQRLYFLESGFVSVIGVAAHQRTVDVALIGREGVIGSTALLGTDKAPHDCCMQMEGFGHSVAPEAVIELRERIPVLHTLLLQFVHVLLVQSAETAVCNQVGAIEQRLARAILMCHDRLDSNELCVTHESLAGMLGVRRASVTVALHMLEGENIIKSLRKRVVILDRSRLENAASGYYGSDPQPSSPRNKVELEPHADRRLAVQH